MYSADSSRSRSGREMLAIVFASNTFKYVSSDLVGARPTAGRNVCLQGIGV